jgi:hypothetical protein
MPKLFFGQIIFSQKNYAFTFFKEKRENKAFWCKSLFGVLKSQKVFGK